MSDWRTKGYPLPAGDAFEDELCCAIVYYPNRDEYRQALLGSITYLATWIAWEKDSQKRGKDAARAWKIALDKTLGCWNMACLDEVVESLTELISLLQYKKDCCDQNITYGPGETRETEIVPGQGNPPDAYGETSVADWDEWYTYLCYQANAYVDVLIDAANQIANLVWPYAIVIGLIAGILAIASGAGILLVVAWETAAAAVGGLLGLASGAVFTDAADDLETARDDIICAIMLNQDLGAAVETALDSGIAWDAFFQFIDYDSALATLYEGGWNGEWLDPQTSQECDCGYGEEPSGQVNGIRITGTLFQTNDTNSGQTRSRNAATGDHGLNVSNTNEWGYDNAYGPPDRRIMHGTVQAINNPPGSNLGRDIQYSNITPYASRAADAKQMWGIAFYCLNSSNNKVTYHFDDPKVNYGADDNSNGDWYDAHLIYRPSYSTFGGTVTVSQDGRSVTIEGTKNQMVSDNWVFFDFIGHGNPIV